MKKIITIVSLIASLISFSQSAKKTTFVIRGGANFSDVIGVESDGEKTGYSGTEFYTLHYFLILN